jgi:hypothetical protein
MASSKELLEVLCLLAKLPTEEKSALLRYLRYPEDTEDSLWPPSSSQGKAE